MWMLAQIPTDAEGIIQTGIVGVVLLLVMAGKLRLDREVTEMREDRDYWRTVATTTIEALEPVPGVLDDLVEQGRLAQQALTAIRDEAAQRRVGP